MANMRAVLAAICVLAIGLQVAQAGSDKYNYFKAWAVPGNEVPPLNAPGLKTVSKIKFTENNGQLSGWVEVKNVVNMTMLHLHVGNAQTNGPVAFWVWPTDTNAPSGQPLTANTVKFYWKSNSTLLQAGAGINYQQFLTALKNKGIYLNVHTTAFPAGAARGQVERD